VVNLPAAPAPLLVATCGNPDAGDDAFGPQVAAALRAQPLPGTVVLDLQLNPWGLADHLEGRQALFILDAASVPGTPTGQVLDFDWFDPARPPLRRESVLSSHALSVGEQLELAQTLGLLPPVVWVIVLVAGSVTPGAPAGPMLEAAVTAAVVRLRELSAEVSLKV
jgi:hydrogenase maturation protease